MKRGLFCILSIAFLSRTLWGNPYIAPGEFQFRNSRFFFPPKKIQSLEIVLPQKEAETLILSWNNKTLSLNLPASRQDRILAIPFPEKSFLLNVAASSRAMKSLRLPSSPQNTVLDRITAPALPPFQLDLTQGDTLLLPRSRKQEGYQQKLSIKASKPLAILTEKQSVSTSPAPKGRTFFFPFMEIPGSIQQIHPLSALEYISLSYEPIPTFPEPLRRDGFQILQTNPENWRQKDYEIYRWLLFPNVLIFDCKNYEIQRRFFRRLAYFAEKKGFRGSILSNEQLKGRHGWNAHDYNSSVLANFFNAAAAKGAILNQEELLLKEILIQEKMLAEKPDGTLMPRNSAVLSLSRESVPSLRARFFVHEGSHGIYFTKPKYRDFVKKIWLAMEEEDRRLWRFFLGWYGYDPSDEDLMINEFQAYSLQQKASEAQAYFAPRLKALIKTYPARKELLERGTGNQKQKFRQWAEILSRETQKNWAVKAGDFSALHPLPRNRQEGFAPIPLPSITNSQ